MVKVTNEKRLPATIRNPWLESFYSTWNDTPWFKEMESMWSQVTESFDHPYDTFPNYMRQFPKDISCDVVDKGDRYILTADLPGIVTDEVKVNVTGRQVEISAEHKDTRKEKSKDFIKNERSFVKYQRVLTVPEKVNESDITANVTNGVLTAELPKRSSSKKELPPQIEIMAKKAPRKEDEKELEHEQAKEEIHQAELEQGYVQDEKFEESED